MTAGVLVTASRTWDDATFVRRRLHSIFLSLGPFTLYHGDCPNGGDRHARRWAESWRMPELRFPADWQSYGRSAGHRRNAVMVDAFRSAELYPKIAIAFRRFGESSAGTTGCIKLLRSAGIEPEIYEYELRSAR